MSEKCKGTGLRISIYRCPKCFETVEIFSDEKKATCTHCSSLILVETANKCMEWCASAGVCMAKTVGRQVSKAKKAKTARKVK
ncbi:MAG: hypothetical protein A2452_01150 [Candidatus Firestonebacteria bacterium RIFOXYC2_FULL_39_67]|nr:MAG: hypothetical protein A2536_04580 [Candidatus Firestonebacteria bacterium RIFOXYD2_FULL_39_29]OGF54034.1 MAG: hypothetical protein A2452_01150 [Candidatus Firestonebacteria bacterium RIFOXYC2_FULL_39_67]OGF57077.1 MAG: hypothetical protein A2497_01400 [Candidatus Firestonebacteria bacterium RifOxyC12_full_39_7]